MPAVFKELPVRVCRLQIATSVLPLVLTMTLSSQGLSSEPPRSASATVLATKHFDQAHITLYWEGGLISSPATITWDGERLRVNGVGPSAPDLDTAGADARLAPIVKGTPFIDSLVASGLSYVAATNRYGCEIVRMFRQAVLNHRRRARLRNATTRVAPVEEELASELGVPPTSITLGKSEFRLMIVGGGTITVPFDAPDSLLTKSPCRPLTTAELRASAIAVADALVLTLGQAGPRVILASYGRTHAISGAEAHLALDQINSACRVYSRRGANGVKQECTGLLLSPSELVQIARRRTHR